MIDAPIPDSNNWIRVGYDSGEFIYQKTSGGYLLPLCVSSKTDCGAPNYREWREMVEGKPWAEIAKGYEGMAKKC